MYTRGRGTHRQRKRDEVLQGYGVGEGENWCLHREEENEIM